MADVVPLNRRVDMWQEILSMEADDEALKVRERQEVKVKVQRSLQEAEAQSFQLYHPQVDQGGPGDSEEGRAAQGLEGAPTSEECSAGSGTRSWSRMRCWTMRWQSWRLSTRHAQDLIMQLGCSPPLGASGPGGGAAKESDPKAKILAGADTTLRTPDQGTRRYPPITTSTVTAVAGKKYIPTGTKHVFWACLVLPSISVWEVVGKEKFKTTGGYMCRFRKGFWKVSRGGTRLLQITAWHKDKATCLQLVMDEPPEQLYNQWIRDRMEFYKRVEPTEPQGRAASPWRCEHPAPALQLLEGLGCLHCPVGVTPGLVKPLQSSSAGGQDLCPHFAVGGQAPGVALVGGWVTSLPGGPAGEHQGDSGAGGRPTSGRPTLLPGHFAQRGSEHSAPRPPVPGTPPPNGQV